MAKTKNYKTSVTNAKGSRTLEFGPCTIKSIEKSANSKNWFLVHLEQIVTTIYTGSSQSSGFTLQNKSEFKPESAFEFEDTRTKTERISKEVYEGEGYEKGDVIEGVVIRRQCWDEPQWDGHKTGFNGKYFTTDLISQEQFEKEGDLYNNEEQMPVKMVEGAAKGKKKNLVATEKD